jgi:hypothetical protein
MKWVIPAVAVFVGAALFCMGVLGQGVYHGVPYLQPRRGTFAGADDTPWQLAMLSGPEHMMLWGMVVAGCGAVSMAIIAVVRAVKRRTTRGT